MWSEPGSVAKSEPLGCTVLECAVYILRRSLLSQEEESGESVTGGGEFWSTCSGASGKVIKSNI